MRGAVGLHQATISAVALVNNAMAYSFKIEQAIRAAAVLHKDQVRKGDMPFPVISHLVAVAMIVADYTDDEDIIAAALLHDTIEDTDYTADELQEDFGGYVRDMVEALSEPQTEDDGGAVGWKRKKNVYAEQLKTAPEGSLIICAADKIHNMRAMVEDYYDDHPKFLANFGGKLEDRLAAYQAIADVLGSRLKTPILTEFNAVFTEYKNFIADVQKTREESF
jgi:GTP diphosphokinase / guanosine-3',5'-bis(diphosphate) 3'-diphosphatase